MLDVRSRPIAVDLVSLWAASGPVLLLTSALWRLGPRALDAVRDTHSLGQGALLAVATAAMVWFEGHRGFHQRVVPETVRRVVALGREWRGRRVVFAPVAACELAFAPPGRVRRRWLLVAGILAAITVTHHLPPDARDLVSAAVFCGLAWGLGSLLLALVRAWRAARRAAADCAPDDRLAQRA